MIHVWRAALSTITPLADKIKRVLSADELTRSEKFCFPDLQQRFVAGRALLRMILGDYCDCKPEDLRFTYSEYQKPAITPDRQLSRTVSFNLSHSENAIQIAVAANGALGVDVEYLEREHNVDALAIECLTEDERLSISHLSEQQRRFAFLRYWVHKEAFLKCLGCGFSVDPKEVNVSFCENGCSVMCFANGIADITLFGRDLPCEPGYVAAVAACEPNFLLQSAVL